MHLTYRPATEEDIETCLGFIPSAFDCDPLVRARMPALWRGWLRAGAMRMTVLEDESRPPEMRRVAFGNSGFLSEEFARSVRAGLPPHLAAQVCERALAGKSPLLDTAALRKSISAGLNLLVVHIGWSENVFDIEDVRRIKAKLIEAFFFTHAGYPIRDFMQEVYSGDEMRRGVAAGMLVYNDYASYWAENPERMPSEEDRPYLLGIDRESVTEGSNISPLFLYTPPRFHFSVGEQELLQLALIDKTDEEMARALHISESAVQKRWQAIFDRAGASSVRWLPNPVEAGKGGRVRGVEKRRHLLSYLRSHPEELRPIASRRAKP